MDAHATPPAHAGAPPEGAAFADLVTWAVDPIVAFDLRGRICFANAAVALLGWAPADLVGRTGTALFDGEALDRASRATAAIQAGFQLPSSAPFAVRAPDGATTECDVASWILGGPTAPRGIAIHLRPTQDARVLHALLQRLLAGEAAVPLLGELLGLVQHRNAFARTAIAFRDEHDVAQVVTDGVPTLLAGVDAPDDAPWAIATDTGDEVLVLDVDELPDVVAGAARAAGLRDCWVVPVPDGDRWALVTEWTAEGGPPAQLDPYSLRLLAQLTELVLQWRRQTVALERAATRDPLTGLPNRRAVEAFDAEGVRRDLGVLYIDLDHFKPVNDRLGHAAGDVVLRIVADRLLGAARATDIVARLGGDEFGIVCPGSSRAELDALATTVHRLIAEPIAVHGDVVTIGSSIGAVLGHDAAAPLLARADQALYAAKDAGRATVRWAD